MKRLLLLILLTGVIIVSGCSKAPTTVEEGCPDTTPVCAEVEIQCIQAPCDPIQQVFDNPCLAEKAGATILYKGNCKDKLDADRDKEILPRGTFKQDSNGVYAGDFYVRGYSRVVAVAEHFCEAEDCAVYSGVVFMITDHNSVGLDHFQQDFAGNSHISETSISLGCIVDDILTYEHLDPTGDMIKSSLSVMETERLLDTDEEHTLALRIMREYKNLGGRGSPACYSHFDSITIDPHLPVEGKISRTGEAASLVRVVSPYPNEDINSPVEVRGEAPGYWFFEATAPVNVVNRDGLIIGEGYITAQEDWMTEDSIPFEGNITFEVPLFMPSRTGWIILRRSNPSGMRENDAAVEIPIMF